MTEKELRKLNRYELLEMLLAQGKKLERLERELAEANERLAQRQQIGCDLRHNGRGSNASEQSF